MAMGQDPPAGIQQCNGNHHKRCLAYPDYTLGVEVSTFSSKLQLGVVITQANRPLEFFSQKLSPAQQKYSVTKQELLATVERNALG